MRTFWGYCPFSNLTQKIKEDGSYSENVSRKIGHFNLENEAEKASQSRKLLKKGSFRKWKTH